MIGRGSFFLLFLFSLVLSLSGQTYEDKANEWGLIHTYGDGTTGTFETEWVAIVTDTN